MRRTSDREDVCFCFASTCCQLWKQVQEQPINVGNNSIIHATAFNIRACPLGGSVELSSRRPCTLASAQPSSSFRGSARPQGLLSMRKPPLLARPEPPPLMQHVQLTWCLRGLRSIRDGYVVGKDGAWSFCGLRRGHICSR